MSAALRLRKLFGFKKVKTNSIETVLPESLLAIIHSNTLAQVSRRRSKRGVTGLHLACATLSTRLLSRLLASNLEEGFENRSINMMTCDGCSLISFMFKRHNRKWKPQMRYIFELLLQNGYRILD